MNDEKPPRVGLGVIKRAAIAAVLIVLSTAGAVSATVILDIKQIQQEFTGGGRQLVDIPEVTKVDPGRARTIMLLGSDKRFRDAKDERPHSDTIILLRVDPKKDFISVMSIPRDLRTTIPGVGIDKINAAFERGGPRMTVRTVKQLLSLPGDPFHVNNVVVLDFGGFQRAVNYIGGVYVDVDRRYFNDRTGPGGFAAINLQPGYQRLPGSDSLDYVRYRHTDDDFVRAARQQGFLRALKNTPRVRDLLDFNRRHDLAKIFRRYIEVDRSLRSTKQIFSLLKLAIAGVLDIQEVRQVKFRAGEAVEQSGFDGEQQISYVTATPDQIASTVKEFMRGGERKRSSSSSSSRSSSRKSSRKRRKRKRTFKVSQVRGLQNGRAAGRSRRARRAAGRGSPSTSRRRSSPGRATRARCRCASTACATRAGGSTARTDSCSAPAGACRSTTVCRGRRGRIPRSSRAPTRRARSAGASCASTRTATRYGWWPGARPRPSTGSPTRSTRS